VRWVDADEREIPVRFPRVKPVHLLEERSHVFCGSGARAPHQVGQRLAPEDLGEGGEMPQVLVRAWPRPARRRIGGECLTVGVLIGAFSLI
jgi:hypothetical protein